MCRIKDYYSYCKWDQTTAPYADFAASESPLSDEDIERWPDLLQIPAVAAAVVPIYNIEGYDPAAPALVLDRAALVGIFSGNITVWNHPKIVSLQHEMVAKKLRNHTIQVVVREDASGTSHVFKKALSKFSAAFKSETGNGNDSTWPGLPHALRRAGNNGVAAGVYLTPNSIGYCGLGSAHAMQVNVADIMQESGSVVTADIKSVEYAMYETGVELNKDNAADLTDARGDNAWPITTYSYAVLRTNILGDRLRQGADCDTVQQTVLFWDWFFTSDALQEGLEELYVVPLAKSTLLEILSKLQTVACGGALIKHDNFAGARTGELLTGHGISIADTLFDYIFEAYHEVDVHTALAFLPNDTNTVEHPLADNEAWRVVMGNQIFEQEWFSAAQYNPIHELIHGADTFLAMPWFQFPLVVIFHIDDVHNRGSRSLVIDESLLRRLVQSEVNSWDDPELNRLNPWLADVFHDDIMHIFGVSDRSDVTYQILSEVLGFEEVSDRAWRLMTHFDSYLQIVEAVEQTSGSIAVLPYVALEAPHVYYADLAFDGATRSQAVRFDMNTLHQCATPSSYHPVTFQFSAETQRESGSTGCYPLTLPVYIVMHYSYSNLSHFCSHSESPGVQTTAFMRHMFLSGEEVEEPIWHRKYSPLMWTAADPGHIERVQAVMTYMPCGFLEPESSEFDWWALIQLAIIGGAILLCLICSCVGGILYYQKVKQLRMNPLYGVNVKALLQEIHDELMEEESGVVASYIPELAKVDPDLFGLAIMSCEGKLYSVGDHSTQFSIQSIAKPFLYAFGISYNGLDMMQEKIGVEPSGAAFNSEKMDPNGRPFNPFINAGAIACCGLLPLGDADSRYAIVKNFMIDLSCSGDLELDMSMYYSETGTADQNRLIGSVLLANNVIESEYDLEHGLESYFMACSTNVTTNDLACMAACLANSGAHPKSKLDILEKDICDGVISVMMTCGMYNGAGNWMVDVGIPAKSGVSGGIIAVVPGVCGIAIYSPRLDKHGNSVRGLQACTELSQCLGLHMLQAKDLTKRTKSGEGSRLGSVRKGSLSSKAGSKRGGSNRGGSNRGGSNRGESTRDLLDMKFKGFAKK